MTIEQQRQIKSIIDTQGWKAVHSHPVLGPLWRRTLKESKEFVDNLERS